MEICSQHSSCTQVAMQHGERIATLENRTDKIEEAQQKMVNELEDAAHGLRALAGKIDSAISVHKKDNGESLGHSNSAVSGSEELTGSLNKAWKHFQTNFSYFVVYGGAGAFIWFVMKTITGDWKWDSNVLKALHGLVGG